MEPNTAIFLAWNTAVIAGKGLKAADERVAEAAAEQDISKDEAWAGINAELRRRGVEAFVKATDPKGWRAAARAYAEAEERQKPDGNRSN